MSNKIKCALIGPGNIGTDLLYKLKRSPVLEPVWMVGIDAASEGLVRARELGLKTTAEGVDGLLPHVKADGVQIAFDATSAYVHAENSRKLNALGVLMIDLTPAAVGPFCVPPVNLAEHVGKGEMNVNMVTCGGQATIPMVAAVSRVQPVAYGEIVATVSSKSAGPGTRKNIDEFTRTTAGAVEKVGGAKVTGGTGGSPAARTSMADPFAQQVVRAARAAADRAFHDGALILAPGMGGTLPLYLFTDVAGKPAVIVPIANHDNNQHAANENLRLANLWYAIDLYAALLTMAR